MTKVIRKKTTVAKQPEVASLTNYDSLVSAIAQAHDGAKRSAVQAVNLALTLRNWLIGYYIVEYEQHGQDRAKYGEKLLDTLTKDLRQRLGRGFGRRDLFQCREFYRCYPIVQSLIAQLGVDLPVLSSIQFKPFEWQDESYFRRLFQKLSWTHLIELIRLDEPLKRAFYEVEPLVGA